MMQPLMLQTLVRPPPPMPGGFAPSFLPGLTAKAAPTAPPLYAFGDGGGMFTQPEPPPQPDMTDLMTGTVKCWFEDRGFGFITPDGGTEDVFVHRGVLADGKSLLPESQVLFDLTYDADKKKFSATRCFGAVMAPMEEEADASAGGRRKKYTGPYCLDDPWQDLYAGADAPHLRAHLDGLPGTEPSGRPAPKAAAKAAAKSRPEPSSAEGKAEKVQASPVEGAAAVGGTGEGAGTEAPKSSQGPGKATKEDSKPTSIYDFFEDAEEEML
eukprot:TRINITY_DN109270_c0_g1_i1.p1 TRINITY_DN109270_c0_g1~~TRINITY_DN109270_c0_g1_i1.p1  ORF type:complete len:269 (-),score=67.13 TRINITY_DN109270_c0_g1_i1:143-949(-)